MANFANSIAAGTLPGTTSATADSYKTNTVDDVRNNIATKAWENNPYFGPGYNFTNDSNYFRQQSFSEYYGIATPYATEVFAKLGNPFDTFAYLKAVDDVQYDLLKAAGAVDGYMIGQAAKRTDDALAEDVLAAMQGHLGWSLSGNVLPGDALIAIITGNRAFDFTKTPQLGTPTAVGTGVDGQTEDYNNPDDVARETAFAAAQQPVRTGDTITGPVVTDRTDCGDCGGVADTMLERQQIGTIPVLYAAPATETIKASAVPAVAGTTNVSTTASAVAVGTGPAMPPGTTSVMVGHRNIILALLAGVALYVALKD